MHDPVLCRSTVYAGTQYYSSRYTVWLHVHLFNFSFVCNHVKLGVSLRALYCVVGLADLWGIVDLHGRKVKSTKSLKHKLKATLGGQYV